MLKRLFISVLITVLFLHPLFSQSLSKKEIRDLHTTIELFLFNKDNVGTIDTARTSEFITLLLDIDSSGRPAAIHIFADERNKNLTYQHLAQLTAQSFSMMKLEKCRRKTVVIPVLSLVPGKSPGYIKNITAQFPIRRVNILSDKGGLVAVDAIRYNPPSSAH